MAADIQRYLDSVELQHSLKPRFMASLTKLLKKLDDGSGIVKALPELFSVEKATGAQLDAIGELVGVSRAFPYIDGLEPALMDDAMYRKVIQLKIASNGWDGTLASFIAIWDSVFADSGITARYHDNQNMTVDVTLSGDISAEFERLLYMGALFPKAMGVGYSYTISGQGDRTAETATNTYAAATVMVDRVSINVI